MDTCSLVDGRKDGWRNQLTGGWMRCMDAHRRWIGMLFATFFHFFER